MRIDGLFIAGTKMDGMKIDGFSEELSNMVSETNSQFHFIITVSTEFIHIVSSLKTIGHRNHHFLRFSTIQLRTM